MNAQNCHLGPFTNLCVNPPRAFNLDARPGLQRAVSAQYEIFCEEFPDSTQEERRQVYDDIYKRLEWQFPTYREIYAEK